MTGMHALYPHLKGRTSLAYSPCGKYLFTVGENMMVRRFLVGSPQDEPETVELNFSAHDIATTASSFAVCGDSGSAELFDLESREKIGGLLRTALPLRSISFSNDGEWVGAVGDDCCRVVNVRDITQTRSIPFENVKHLEFHPVTPSIVALTGLDSTIRVYDLDQQKVVGEVESVVPSVTEFGDDRSTAAAWSPQGECFAVPTKTFEIALVSTKDWLMAARLSDGHANAVTTCAWSPNGRYIASGGRDDKVLVWDACSRSIIRSYDVAGILEVRWHPHNNELSFVTNKGQLYTVTDVIPDTSFPPFGGDPIDPLAAVTTNSTHPSAAAANKDDVSSDLDVEDNLFVSDNENNNVSGDEDGYEQEAAGHISSHHSRHSHNGYHGRHEDIPRSHKRQRLDLGSSHALSPQQTPFQSGSTPWLNQKRYLCMSPVGYVWCVRHTSSHNSATITFFDQSVHREVHFHDNDQFDLAALTAQACIFGNSSTGKVAVRFHSSLNDNWETQLDLGVDGGVQCVALSSEVAVVFTKSGFMRTYTLYGTPLSVTCVGNGSGKASGVVTCSAHGNEVLVVYQQSSSYTYTYEDVARGKMFQSHSPLGITPGSKLKALFFSEEGEPCIMDSTGILSTLVHGRQQGQPRWVPVLGAPRVDEEIQRKYWPLGIQESKLLCVVLKGQQQFPSLPMPITDEVDLQIPGLGSMEAQYLVARTQHEQLQDRLEYYTEQLGVEPDESMQDMLTDSAIELDKLLLRQFQQACQDSRLNRGLQIVQLIQTPESLQAAAKVASAYELTSLASRIQEAID